MRDAKIEIMRAQGFWWIGRRVEIPAWSDWWMRGARFGEVVAEKPRLDGDGKMVRVALDAGRATGWFNADDVKEV